MTDIFTIPDAVQYCGTALRSSLNSEDRLCAARVLGSYDYGGQPIREALLPGLTDPCEAVRLETYRAFTRHHFDYLPDLLDIARALREAISMEHPGTPAFNAGWKALNRISEQAEELALSQRSWLCQDHH